MDNLKFEEMNLSDWTLKAVKDMGFEEASQIQSQAIPLIMAKKDVIGQSQTGTGKTAAFGIPCLEMIDVDNRHLQALILCPTRELAIQVSEEFRKLLKFKDNIRVLPIYGGQPIDRQIMALKKGAQVVIGTPGRVMDHMRRHTLKMGTVKYVVLDEADEMLDMGFREDIETILEKVPEERQTVMFSATMSDEILSLSKKYLKAPEYIKISRKELTVPQIEQCYFDVREKNKLEALCRLIDVYSPKLAIVFCNTKKRVDDVTEQLLGRGYFADGLHGDLKQQQRDRVMQKFRSGAIEILVATDVAARGIDVDNVDIVFNYDIPDNEEYYVHRIGRTGRAGKSGTAFTFCSGREIYKLRDIMTYAKTKIEKRLLPTLDDIEQTKTDVFVEKLRNVINKGGLEKYAEVAENMLDDDTALIDVAAALIKMQLGNTIADYSSSENDLNPVNPKNVSKPVSKDKDMVRLFVNAGKNNKIRAKDIVGAFAGETGVPGQLIGEIKIYDDFAYVDVPYEYAKEIIEGMKNSKIKGKRISIEKAKKPNSQKHQSHGIFKKKKIKK
ncbi:MAG: DEAD/DEAH box helicase [Clostridia bacterium]|jgi:ATP-dependent RNA helicase DeaD|nr:DEAD/DEAH box helicase [Clostridia bacterium]MCI2000317.1 DEAD/DEAH box helicase [Clostridia bacterium]MCI2015497.1 DEAD/DEAH box helicase [Clostridia bacterium]